MQFAQLVGRREVEVRPTRPQSSLTPTSPSVADNSDRLRLTLNKFCYQFVCAGRATQSQSELHLVVQLLTNISPLIRYTCRTLRWHVSFAAKIWCFYTRTPWLKIRIEVKTESHRKDTWQEREAGKVVVYTTTMGIVRSTYQRCLKVRQILRTHLVKFDERDVFMSRETQAEIKERMNSDQILVPQVFIEGQYIGVSNKASVRWSYGATKIILKIHRQRSSEDERVQMFIPDQGEDEKCPDDHVVSPHRYQYIGVSNKTS
ncbi:Glutaredoxin domain-containing cysteine-rich protein 1, partial [Homalodisca vitripennis]